MINLFPLIQNSLFSTHFFYLTIISNVTLTYVLMLSVSLLYPTFCHKDTNFPPNHKTNRPNILQLIRPISSAPPQTFIKH